MTPRRFRHVTSCLRIAAPQAAPLGGKEEFTPLERDKTEQVRVFEGMCQRQSRKLLFVDGMRLSADDDSNPTQSSA